MEKCTNCDREISNLEQAFVFQGKIICSDCNLCLEQARHSNNPELFANELRRQSLAYALQIIEPVPTLKKLGTLASRFNVTHRGAGGLGLEFAKNYDGYKEVADSINKLYLGKFQVIAAQLYLNVDQTSQQRKTKDAKIKVWNKARNEILDGYGMFKYDLQGLKNIVDALITAIDREIETLK
jgi:hypothetical protein